MNNKVLFKAEGFSVDIQDHLKMEEALSLCILKHKDQKRKNDSPYSNHPVNMTFFARSYFQVNNYDLLCAIALHDTVEDTDLTIEDIRLRFGDTTANWVKEVTREPDDNKLRRRNTLINKSKMFSNGGKVIKSIDRVFNLADAYDDFSPEKLYEYTDEAIELYYTMNENYVQLNEDFILYSLAKDAVGFLGRTISSIIDLCISEKHLDSFIKLEERFKK